MKDVTMQAGKRKKLKKRDKAGFKTNRTHSDKLSSYRQSGSVPSPSGATEDKKENTADREYRRMLGGDVFHGSSKKSPAQNKSNRRNK